MADPTGPVPGSKITELTALIVSSAVGNEVTRYQASDLPDMIKAVRVALAEEQGGVTSGNATAEKAPPMTKAQWGKLITPEGIKSLLDGKTYKTLKRHLSRHGHDPKSYREAHGLPADFPIVSPEYSKLRSETAKRLGLGARAQPAVAAKAKSRGRVGKG